ncbi:MAG: TIGR01777 family oxidoreductase [Gemmatimonadota bacterium]
MSVSESPRVLVTGSSGLIGSALVSRLTAEGHHAVRLVRRRPVGEGAVWWDPVGGSIDAERLEGLDAAVHLAGENIASGTWTAERKRRIRESRVAGTRLLSKTLAARTRPPEVLVCASAIGFYGDRGDEPLDEESPAGTGFLPETCVEWEAAADPARVAGIRVVHLRFGVVLSPRGGALARMLPVFRLGLGGRLGDGRQVLSWVSLDDAVSALMYALHAADLAGPVNATAPNPVRNIAFTRALGRVLRRPTVLCVPAPVLRLALGELGDTLLGGARVLPVRLLESGFTFRDPEVEGALRRMLS